MPSVLNYTVYLGHKSKWMSAATRAHVAKIFEVNNELSKLWSRFREIQAGL